MDSIIMAIVLYQIHMQGVEYILDDQTINSELFGGSIINLHYLPQLQETGCGQHLHWLFRYTCRQLNTYWIRR